MFVGACWWLESSKSIFYMQTLVWMYRILYVINVGVQSCYRAKPNKYYPCHLATHPKFVSDDSSRSYTHARKGVDKSSRILAWSNLSLAPMHKARASSIKFNFFKFDLDSLRIKYMLSFDQARASTFIWARLEYLTVIKI